MIKYPKCSVEWCHKEDMFCDRSADRKCLFHCDKSGWYSLRSDGSKDWFTRRGNVDQFWRELIAEKIDKKDYQFTLFVFPPFPLSNPFNHANAERIAAEVRFTGTKFLSRASFGSLWLENAAFFDGAVFNEAAEFSHVEFLKHATFSNTKFLGGLTFTGIFYEDTDFRNAVFSPDHPTRFYPYFPSRDYAVFRGKTEFSGINFPKSVKFSHVDLSNVSFSSSNLEEVRLLGCTFKRVHGRYELYDERRVFSTSGGQISPAYFGVVEDMYRQLKCNFESRKDWRNAGEFYISEMEMRRLRLKIEANDLKILKEVWSQAKVLDPPKTTKMEWLCERIPKVYMGKWWRRSLERFFLAGFSCISRYGEQPDRALLWIGALVGAGMFSIFIAQNGSDLNGAALTAVRAVTFQQENRFDDISRSTQWTITLLRVGSAVLIPLFLLALRRCFRR